ncbi:MAG: hypothetical protein Q7S48_01440 [bacterium]|nr:hypothetical protein [bacterium]
MSRVHALITTVDRILGGSEVPTECLDPYTERHGSEDSGRLFCLRIVHDASRGQGGIQFYAEYFGDEEIPEEARRWDTNIYVEFCYDYGWDPGIQLVYKFLVQEWSVQYGTPDKKARELTKFCLDMRARWPQDRSLSDEQAFELIGCMAREWHRLPTETP